MWPDQRLRKPAEPVGAVTDEIRALWDDMIETMYAMPGVGLAAPQIGVSLRVAVVDGEPANRRPLRLADPVLIEASSTFRDYEEASPNLPGVSAAIRRPSTVSVSYLDETGTRVRKDLAGLWATSVQHQIDHLDGRMYFDRLSPVKRRMLLDRAAKVAKRAR
jgi:peptide deformylase